MIRLLKTQQEPNYFHLLPTELAKEMDNQTAQRTFVRVLSTTDRLKAIVALQQGLLEAPELAQNFEFVYALFDGIIERFPMDFFLESGHVEAFVSDFNIPAVQQWFKDYDLMHAIGGNTGKVKRYVRNGANVNASIGGNTPLISSVNSPDYLGKFYFLLENGAQPNLQNKNGRTALYYAIAYRNEAAVKKLLELGADLNKQDRLGRTPFWGFEIAGQDVERMYNSYRVEETDKILQILELVLQAGANVHASDLKGKTLLSRLQELMNGQDALKAEALGYTPVFKAIAQFLESKSPSKPTAPC